MKTEGKQDQKLSETDWLVPIKKERNLVKKETGCISSTSPSS